MERASRRVFLKQSAAAGMAAGAGLASAGLFPRESSGQAKPAPKLPTRLLGSTGYHVTEIGFGLMTTRDPELMQAAIDAGITYFDTANSYMQGVNEEVFGQVVKKNDRTRIYITTKVNCRGRSAQEVRQMMETSIKRLQCGYVDILLMHQPPIADIQNKDYMNAYAQAKKDGLCKFIGFSTHSDQANLLNAAVDMKFWDAVLVGYNFETPQEVTNAMEKARKAGMAMIAMKTLLKGKAYSDPLYPKATPAQSALRWVLQHPFVDTVIPGMTAFEHLTENLALAGTKTGFLDRIELNRYAENLKGVYCRGVAGCTGCQNQCPLGVDVHEINRCLGYAYGYGDLRLARENYAELPASTKVDRCGGCDVCTVKCVNGIDLNDSVRRAKQLFA
jgi:uncharacterized protein